MSNDFMQQFILELRKFVKHVTNDAIFRFDFKASLSAQTAAKFANFVCLVFVK
jgi:hypothetical protein